MKRHFLLRIDSFDGRDTFVRCGDEHQDHLFAIVVIDERGQAEIVDNGYRSQGEALSAWPEAGAKKAI